MARDSNCGRRFVVLLVLGFAVIMAACGKKQEEEVEIDGTVYTNEEVYINSFECGYLHGHFPKYVTVIIETPDQLEYVLENYSMSGWIEEMAEQYPINEYTYFIRYKEVSNGGYYLHADKIVIRNDSAYFLMDSESYEPKGLEPVPMVMGGFFHMAAVPKAYLMDYDFSSRDIIQRGEREED